MEHGDRHIAGTHVAVQSTDITGGHAEIQRTQGVADGHGLIAYGNFIGIADGNGMEARGLDFQHSHVVAGIAADDGCIVERTVIHGHLDGAGTLNDMVVGHNVAILRDDEAGTAGRKFTGPVAVGGGAGGRNAHGGIHIHVIDFFRRQILVAGIGMDDPVDHHIFILCRRLRGCLGLGVGRVLIQQVRRHGASASTAHQGTGHGHRYNFRSLAALLGLGSLRRGERITAVHLHPAVMVHRFKAVGIGFTILIHIAQLLACCLSSMAL